MALVTILDRVKVDLTVLAVPGFVAAMAGEFAWQRRHPVGGRRAGDYEFADTMASLTMGVGSLVAPYITGALLAPVTPRTGRYATVLMGLSLAGAGIATVGDVVRRTRTTGLLDAGTLSSSSPRIGASDADLGGDDERAVPDAQHMLPPALRRITGSSAVTALASTVVTVSTLWSAETASRKLFRLSPFDLGKGPLAYAVAILGWDFLYYWNHRLDHESRWLWAMHVVHHSSERYNLSTALRQPVAEELTIPVIGIGAGGGVDGQVLVMHDMLGINKGFSPRFLRRYADLSTTITEAVQAYIKDVKTRDFPNEKEQY